VPCYRAVAHHTSRIPYHQRGTLIVRVLVLTGPTASGKTAVGIVLAHLLKGEIVSADSRQIYRGLDIGTAKPTLAERREVPHHLIDILDPGEEYSAGMFGKQARQVVLEIAARGKTPIVVGGAGLYIRALVDGLHAGPGADAEIRARLEQRVVEEGVGALMEELRRCDPATASAMRTPTARRVVRALEVFHLTGTALSEYQREQKVQVTFDAVFAGLSWERRTLYERINSRCEEMVRSGLLEEIEMLEGLGYGVQTNALNSVGYKEGMAYRRGEIRFDEMMRLFKQNSRRYAKRQLTWFRRDERIQWFAMEEGAGVGEKIAGLFQRSR
jgi:tRNA dimethylallyltransferase